MKFVPASVSQKVARVGLVASKNSPKTLFGLGLVGVVGGTVLACRATLKLETILDETERDLKIAKGIDNEEYSEEDRIGDIRLIYIQAVGKMAREFAPAIIVGGAGIACLTKSHRILTERNAAITAAYIALEEGFNQYRARVVEKHGEEADRNFRYGTRVDEIIGENGKTKKITRVALGEPSMYAQWFDTNNPNWSYSGQDYNYLFLRNQERYANELLRARGHLVLNDVYHELGLERTTAGAVVGWVLNNSEGGDNYISFGIFDEGDKIEDFKFGEGESILLDFNVDGMVYHKIDKTREEREWQLPR